MRACLVTAFMLLTSLSATAAEVEADVCRAGGGIAESVMKDRQAGVSRSEQFDAADDMKINENRLAVRRLIVLAYDLPRYSTDPERRNAVVHFLIQMRKQCEQTALR